MSEKTTGLNVLVKVQSELCGNHQISILRGRKDYLHINDVSTDKNSVMLPLDDVVDFLHQLGL